MKKILYKLAIVILPLGVILLVVFRLNYSGFCFKEFRYLSDRDMCQYVYDLALMAQRTFDAQGMTDFVARSNQVLTKLTKH